MNALDNGTVAALFAALAMMPLAIAGLALLFAGLTRTRSVSHCLFVCLGTCGVAIVAFLFCGFAIFGGVNAPSLTLTFAGHHWSWIGSGPLFIHGQKADAVDVWPYAWFGMVTASMAALIPVGTGVERWRTGPALCCAAIAAAFTFPLFAHWIWGGGWLGPEGVFGPAAVTDAGGSGSIQMLGGIGALSAAWILGARRGKYNAAGIPLATPGHNAPFITTGCLLALPGWIGLNASGGILFSGISYLRLPFIAVGTLIAGAGGAIAAAAITRIRFGKPDASLTANGWIAGLVASSAGCATAQPAQALLTGLVAGTLVIFSIEVLELRWRIDDPAGAISVHLLGGAWGLLAAGLFDGPERLLGQLLGIATLLGFVLPVTYGVDVLINRFVPFRASVESERQGMDLAELGAGAYPEFMIHRDDLGFR